MYSKQTQGKASKGSVQIKNSNSRLQLVFSHAGKRHYLSLGLPDNKVNRKAAEAKAKLIESDIAFDRFDPTLTRYKPQSALSTITPVFTPTAISSLAELWEKFIEYKRPQCSPSTMRFQYRVFSKYLAGLPTHDLNRANEIRDFVLKTIPVDSAKRFITRLSACCDWAMKPGLITDNPFKGMAGEIKLPKASNANGVDDINPFNAAERDAILNTFQNNTICPKFSRVKHSYYFPFVFMLFHTGARPSEAIALQWKHISSDFRLINFEQAIVESEDGTVCKQGLKTQERRRFPCNGRMQAFLQSIKPENASPQDLVFPSPNGKWIDSNNFRNRVWKPVLKKLGIEYRKLYQTRHTFITLALESGLDAKDVARLVGNSPEVIYRHYAGNKRELFVPEF
jgi:integrase